jgi:DNA-binding NtrC family response regulator
MLPTVLFVDDDAALLAAIRRAFHREPFRLLTAQDTAAARVALGGAIVDVLVCDHMMPRARGTDFLAEVRLMYPEVIPIMLTGSGDLRVAVDAVAAADVFRIFTKPCDARELGHAIGLALRERDAIREARRLLRHALPDPVHSYATRAAPTPQLLGERSRDCLTEPPHESLSD